MWMVDGWSTMPPMFVATVRCCQQSGPFYSRYINGYIRIPVLKSKVVAFVLEGEP